MFVILLGMGAKPTKILLAAMILSGSLLCILLQLIAHTFLLIASIAALSVGIMAWQDQQFKNNLVAIQQLEGFRHNMAHLLAIIHYRNALLTISQAYSSACFSIQNQALATLRMHFSKAMELSYDMIETIHGSMLLKVNAIPQKPTQIYSLAAIYQASGLMAQGRHEAECNWKSFPYALVWRFQITALLKRKHLILQACLQQIEQIILSHRQQVARNAKGLSSQLRTIRQFLDQPASCQTQQEAAEALCLLSRVTLGAQVPSTPSKHESLSMQIYELFEGAELKQQMEFDEGKKQVQEKPEVEKSKYNMAQPQQEEFKLKLNSLLESGWRQRQARAMEEEEEEKELAERLAMKVEVREGEVREGEVREGEEIIRESQSGGE